MLVVLSTSISCFFIYRKWGRRVVYTTNQQVTIYPGSGDVTKPFLQKIFVVPKGNGRPLFATKDSESLFSREIFDIYDIKSQDQIIYVVGYFNGWEDIKGSKDKYMVINYPNSDITKKFRIAFQKDNLYLLDLRVL